MHLEQMHSLYKPSLKSRVFRVYRGLNMPLKDFDKTIRAEVKNLIAFDSFLSTSLKEEVARQFALDKRDPKNESILFSIEIDAHQMERPFADISRWSFFKHECEVLFSIGTVFRIDDVAKNKDSQGIWIVHLITVSEKDKQLQKETQQIQATLLDFFKDVLHAHHDANDYRKIPASNANVASMYYKQGEYEESLFFYEKALETLNKLESTDPFTKATYITNVAKTHMALGHDDKALILYKKALDIRRQSCESNDPSLIHTLHTIGDIYREKKYWNEAFKQYNQALELQLGSTESRRLSDPSSVATTYICIANIFHPQEKYQEALDAFSNALKQHYEHLPEHHPVLAFLYNNIGAMYYKLKQYQLALENQLKCLDIELKVLPQDHKTFAETYKNIAQTYEKLRQFDEAIQFANKYIEQLKLHHLQGSEELNEAMNLLKTIQVKRD
jgi:tetratricopeptide (TPR) repeat protein